MHTEGSAAVQFEKAWPAAEVAACRQVGYKVTLATHATVSAVPFNPDSGECGAGMR